MPLSAGIRQMASHAYSLIDTHGRCSGVGSPVGFQLLEREPERHLSQLCGRTSSWGRVGRNLKIQFSLGPAQMINISVRASVKMTGLPFSRSSGASFGTPRQPQKGHKPVLSAMLSSVWKIYTPKTGWYPHVHHVRAREQIRTLKGNNLR